MGVGQGHIRHRKPCMAACVGCACLGPPAAACCRPCVAPALSLLCAALVSTHPVPAGEAITFFTEEDAGQLRGIANVMRAAGCEVPDWMLALKKERHHRKRKAPEAGGISTAPMPDRKQQGKGQKRRQQQQGKGKSEAGGSGQQRAGGGKAAKQER